MLVLSRKKNESIVVGTDVVVKLIEIRGDRVRLGISAPTTVEVHRTEVFAHILKERGADFLKRLSENVINLMKGFPSDK